MTTLTPPYPLAEVAGPGRDGDPDVLLVVGDWESRCSACGGGATTTERAHATRIPDLAYGCGRRFTAVAMSDDAARTTPVMVAFVARDLGLSYVGRCPWPRRGGAA